MKLFRLPLLALLLLSAAPVHAGMCDWPPVQTLIEHFWPKDETSADHFYSHKSTKYVDPEFGWRWPVPGRTLEPPTPLFGGKAEGFHLLGSSDRADTYMGSMGKISGLVMKKYKADLDIAEWKFWWDREIKLTEYLRSKGFRVARINFKDEGTRTIAKEYIAGATLKDIEFARKHGDISEAKYKEIKSKYDAVRGKLGNFGSSQEFKNWAKMNGLDTGTVIESTGNDGKARRNLIDFHNQTNFVYYNGEWVLIDP